MCSYSPNPGQAGLIAGRQEPSMLGQRAQYEAGHTGNFGMDEKHPRMISPVKVQILQYRPGSFPVTGCAAFNPTKALRNLLHYLKLLKESFKTQKLIHDSIVGNSIPHNRRKI